MVLVKLNVLKESGVIDGEIYDYALAVFERIKAQDFYDVENNRIETFLIHLAMATARQKAREGIDPLDESIVDEIYLDEDFSRAKELWQDFEAMAPVKFSQAETDCFYLHLCNMLKKEES